MNINFKRVSREVEIEKLSEGETFISADEIGWNEPGVFMVIDEPCQVFKKAPGYERYEKYAINLESGKVIGFYNNDKVIVIDCDLNATIQ